MPIVNEHTTILNHPPVESNPDSAALQARLDELTREMNQFTYIVSHDLQAPLRMVTGFLELLAKRYDQQLNEEARQFISYAIRGSSLMKRLIGDLLEYSRVSNTVEDLVPTDLGEIIATAREQLSAAVVSNGELDEQIIISGVFPVVAGRRDLLIRLFRELLNNALKFRSPDRNPEITVKATRQDQEWKIVVQDNGIGIDPVFFEKIFQVFRRLHSGEELYPGTGMGLALCRKIIAMHGGRIGVHSVPGAGAEFWIILPEL